MVLQKRLKFILAHALKELTLSCCFETDKPGECKKYWSVKQVVFYLLPERLQLHHWSILRRTQLKRRGTQKKIRSLEKHELWQKTERTRLLNLEEKIAGHDNPNNWKLLQGGNK